MEFKPRAPREGINVSKTHPLKEAATLVVGLSAIVAGLVFVIAWSVDFAVGFISPEAEARLFESLELDPLFKEDKDDRLPDVQRLLDRLAAHWDDAAYDFKAVILPEGEPNAAALPGGYVMVTTALLDEVESENELAFVLGHELGHFRNRDHLRRLGRGVVYGLALSVVFGSSGSSPDLANLVGDLTSRSFDREQERDADRFGLELIHAEYGHVGSAWEFFQRLRGENPDLEEVVAYLSTHPASAERIDELRQYAEERGWALEGSVEAF